MYFGRKLSDYYLERVKPVVSHPPEDRKEVAKGLPILFQGNQNVCVPYSVLFVGMLLYKINILDVFPKFLDAINFDSLGSKPSKVLDLARKLGIIKNYFYLKSTNKKALSEALKVSPLMFGVYDWFTIPGGHSMVMLEELNDGWFCIKWDDKDKADFCTIPFEQPITFAVAFGDLPEGDARLHFFDALWQVIKTGLQAFVKNLN